MWHFFSKVTRNFMQMCLTKVLLVPKLCTFVQILVHIFSKFDYKIDIKSIN